MLKFKTFNKLTRINCFFFEIKNNIASYNFYPFPESIQDSRSERLANEELSSDPTKVEKLRLKENVLERNLSPSLQQK